MSDTVIKYGDHSIDYSKLPAKSIRALLTRGLAHRLGNEVSSKVIGHFRALVLEEAGSPTGAAREAVLRGLKLDTESVAYRQVKAKFQNEAIAELEAGTIGEARGPRADPFEAEVAKIVKGEVVSHLKANGLHTGTKHPAEGQEYDFNGRKVTFGELQARWLAKHEARVHKEARSRLDAEARKAKQAEKAAADRSGPVDLDSFLG